MEGDVSDVAQLTRANYTDNQKMMHTSVVQEPGSSGQQISGWQDDVETLTPSPVIQQPPPTTTPPMARRRFQHNFPRESWDGGGGGSRGGGVGVVVAGGVGGGGGQMYQPSKYGLVVEEIYGHDAYEYQHQGFEPPSSGGYRYTPIAMSADTGGGQPRSAPNPSVLHHRGGSRGPVDHRLSYPDSQQILDDYYDGYGSSSTAGGSTSGYGSGGGGYDYPGKMLSPPVRKSAEFMEGLSTPKPRSILRNSHSQGQLHTGRGSDRADRTLMTGSPPLGYSAGHQDALQSQGTLKKTVGDLRQWQQQHQEELLNQHIETQALYEKQGASLDTLVRQLGVKEDDPSRWEPIRRAADNIIREKNMIIEKLRQRVLELEEDLKMTDGKLRQALLATDDKADIVHHKMKELQYKNSNLKAELAETRTKKNGEINSLEEQLGATEHEVQQLKSQLKMKEADFSALENKLLGKEKELEEWGNRFQEMKANHQQLRHKLDSVERYLADLPTAEETMKNTQEILRLKEEHAQSKFKAEDLERKLSQTRKQLSARDLRLKDLERQEADARQRAQDLEKELERVQREDKSACSLLRTEQELEQMQQEKERVVIDLEKAKKLLETTHRRLRQTEVRLQSELMEVRERLGQEEEAVGALRQEVIDKEQQIDKTKRLVKELGAENQDLQEQNMILKEQLTQLEHQSTDDGLHLQRRFMTQLTLCFSELQSLVQVCLQRARGEDPNMSVLLGVKDAVSETEEDEQCGQAGGGQDKGQTMKQWLSKLGELRQEVDSLRASLCNQYAEDMGQNIQCATQ